MYTTTGIVLMSSADDWSGFCELPMLCLDGFEILVVLRRCDGEQQ